MQRVDCPQLGFKGAELSIHFTRRSAMKMAAVVTASSLVLAGCSRGDSNEEASGGAENKDARVAAVGLGDADTLLALGVTPSLVSPWGAQGDVPANGVGPWSQELIGDAKPDVVYDTATGFTSEVLEKISANDPSQIIAVNQAVDQQAKTALEDIAPTTLKPEGTENWLVPWRDQVTTIADAVDKKDKGEELIKETEKAFEDFKSEHPELKGKKAAIVMPYDGKLGLYTSGDGRGQFIESMGFEIPQALEGDSGEFYRDIAPENFGDLNQVDYLFVLDYHGAADVLKDDVTFKNLPIMKEKKVVFMQEDVGNAMSMPNPVTIPWAINKFGEALK